MADVLKEDAEDLFSELTTSEKKSLTDKLIQVGVDLSEIGALKESGQFLLYAPFSFIITIFERKPDVFFDGGVWKKSLSPGNEDLLGNDVVIQARNKIIQQYHNYLQDVIIFSENKYSDQDTYRRTLSSINFH